jgi:hypothetical protein
LGTFGSARHSHTNREALLEASRDMSVGGRGQDSKRKGEADSAVGRERLRKALRL